MAVAPRFSSFVNVGVTRQLRGRRATTSAKPDERHRVTPLPCGTGLVRARHSVIQHQIKLSAKTAARGKREQAGGTAEQLGGRFPGAGPKVRADSASPVIPQAPTCPCRSGRQLMGGRPSTQHSCGVLCRNNTTNQRYIVKAARRRPYGVYETEYRKVG